MPLADLRAPRIVRLLARCGIEPIVAVRPHDRHELPAVVEAFASAGLRVAPWPMIADEDGRWASTRNAGTFAAFALAVADDLVGRGLPVGEIVVDLEPPFASVRALLDGRVRAAAKAAGSKPPPASGRDRLGALARELRDRGIAPSAAAVPVALAPGAPGRGWQRALGTPIDGLPWEAVIAMLYTSILEGWSRRLLARRDAVDLLAAGCKTARARFGERAAASLGAVGTGALGDEPIYRDPAELAEDAGVARGEGIEDLALFELGGVLARPPAEAWLEAFVHAPPIRAGAASPRAHVMLGVSAVAGVLGGALAKAVDRRAFRGPARES